MNLCIICREETDVFSDEHVIPDALGGYYHIYSVCKKCNSDLGSFVDSKLVNHQFSTFQRFSLGLKGKSNKLPNPFVGTHHLVENENMKVQLRLNNDNIPAPYTVTDVQYENIDNGITKINISIDASDEKRLDGIFKKISKKLNMPIEKLEGVVRTVQTIEHPNIKCSMNIDLAEFKIGLLKIAYEFAVDSLEEYFLDPSAVEISQVLKTSDYGSTEKFVDLGSGFDHGLFDSMSHILDLESKKHYLILLGNNNNGLICLIHLHGMFSIGVTLSKQPYSENIVIVGINDLTEKTFRKAPLKKLLPEIYAQSELRFQYYFNSEYEKQCFLIQQAKPEFDFYKVADQVPLFNRDGIMIFSNLNHVMTDDNPFVSTEMLADNVIAHTYQLQDEAFIKIIPSQMLIKIVAVREELKQLSKL